MIMMMMMVVVMMMVMVMVMVMMMMMMIMVMTAIVIVIVITIIVLFITKFLVQYPRVSGTTFFLSDFDTLGLCVAYSPRFDGRSTAI